jgi:hypothetical protein
MLRLLQRFVGFRLLSQVSSPSVFTFVIIAATTTCAVISIL